MRSGLVQIWFRSLGTVVETIIVLLRMNLGFIKMQRIFSLADETLAFKDFHKVSSLSLQ